MEESTWIEEPAAVVSVATVLPLVTSTEPALARVVLTVSLPDRARLG